MTLVRGNMEELETGDPVVQCCEVYPLVKDTAWVRGGWGWVCGRR